MRVSRVHATEYHLLSVQGLGPEGGNQKNDTVSNIESGLVCKFWTYAAHAALWPLGHLTFALQSCFDP